MMSKKSVIQQIIVLLTIYAMLGFRSAVSGDAAEKLVDERLQTDSLFNTAGSTPPKLTASKPASSKGGKFSSASVWIPKKTDHDWLDAWQECGSDINCVLEYMKKSGASEESMQFTRKISKDNVPGYLDTFEEKGRIDLGAVFFPGRANTNGMYVLLNGSPSLVSTELNWDALDISRDPNYSRLKKQYPELQVWTNSAQFISLDANSDGGQTFIFSYLLVNQCHACGVGWTARVAFDFDRNGIFKGMEVLKLIPDENVLNSTVQKDKADKIHKIADILPNESTSAGLPEWPGLNSDKPQDYGEDSAIGHGYCTDYVKLAYKTATGIALPFTGNASGWYGQAKNTEGFRVIPATDISKAPPGAIAVWDNGGYGHVAFVKSNDGANSITFAEANWGKIDTEGKTEDAITFLRKEAITRRFNRVDLHPKTYADAQIRSPNYKLLGFMIPN